MYCLRDEAETKMALLAALVTALRFLGDSDGVGLDDRPLVDFMGDGFGFIKSSHCPSSSDVV